MQKNNQEFLAWIQAFAEEKNATVAQISLAWIVDKKPYLVPIPGTRKLERLKENVGASDILLTSEEVKKIDAMLEQIPMSEVFGGTKVTKQMLIFNSVNIKLKSDIHAIKVASQKRMDKPSCQKQR